MAKVKLTKNELKKQKDALKRFTRYLPTLVLKKQQLQTEIAKIQQLMEELLGQIQKAKQQIDPWISVFSEDVSMGELLKVKEITVEQGNIAGIDIPVFKKLIFDEKPYDLMKTPLWVDYGIEAIKQQAEIKVKYQIFQKQETLILEELVRTTQRVNLFEKVKIPDTKENIRKIQIFLGDMQTASVVTGKIAKDKIAKKQQLAELEAV